MITMATALIGALGIAVALVLLSYARRRRNEAALTKAQFQLYAARDELIRMAIVGDIQSDGELFLLLYDWINHVIRTGKHVDLRFIARSIQHSKSPQARAAWDSLCESLSPAEDHAIDEISRQIATAIFEVGRANSRFFRLVLAASKAVSNTAEVDDYDSLTATALATAA